MAKVSVRKRGNKWQYYFEGAKINGKRNRIGESGFESEKLALKAGNDALYQYNNAGSTFKPSEISVSDLLDEWLETVKPNRAPATYIAYRGIVNNRIKPAIGAYHLKSISIANVQAILNDMQNKQLRKSTMKLTLAVINLAFNYAVYPRKLIVESPSKHLTLPKSNTVPVEKIAVDLSTFNRIMKAAPAGNPLHIAAIIAFHTGMRKSEILGLTWDNIDLENGMIEVAKQLKFKGRKLYFGELKSKASYRKIKIGQTLIEHLKAQKARILKNRVRLGELYTVQYLQTDGTMTQAPMGDNLTPVRAYPVCLHDHGQIVNIDSLKHYLNQVKRKLDLPNVTFHSFRHAHATLLIESGANIKAVSVRLGHSDPSVTMRVYAHLTDNMENETVALLEKALSL